MRKIFALPYVLLVMLILSACSSGGFKADHAYKIDSFSFTNQNNEEVSLDDLKGSVWLAQFIFTECTSVCPPMMINMAEIQDKLVEEGVEDYKIVSFSVDPEVDTPEALQTYLELFDVADESKWELLTGYTQDDISKISVKSFKMPVIDDPNSNQVIHGVRFGLVNQKGEVVKTYTGDKDVQFDEIVTDVKALIKSES